MSAISHINVLDAVDGLCLTGRVQAIGASHIVADGPLAAVGAVCDIDTPNGGRVLAEIVAVNMDGVRLMPFGKADAILPGARVTLSRRKTSVVVGDDLGGRLVDALGQPLDGQGDIPIGPSPETMRIPEPLSRANQSDQLPTGVKAVDALMPIVKGQRIGIFAASGVGKTTLITQLARQISCERCVLCLVGERGREVEHMWQSVREGQSPLAEISIVAATSDQSAAMRVRAVEQALAMAEYWRDQGQDVLIVFDSITRYAMALREIGLAAGEPPTLRAYTPNVFSALPTVVERCGSLKSGGSITGLFNVLSETDDVDDPIVEAMKSYLDGHIILSRDLAERGHYPAIDVLSSISRLASDVMLDDQAEAAQKALAALSTFNRSKILIESGIYKSGSDAEIDAAIMAKPRIDDFLKQGVDENIRPEKGFSDLRIALAEAIS